jgi:hypothetical protein
LGPASDAPLGPAGVLGHLRDLRHRTAHPPLTNLHHPHTTKEIVMSFRFRKSIKLLPGVRLNLGSKSASVTLGSGRVHETLSTTGRRTTSVRIARGLSWRSSSRRR